jgi:hypothetical protein
MNEKILIVSEYIKLNSAAHDETNLLKDSDGNVEVCALLD